MNDIYAINYILGNGSHIKYPPLSDEKLCFLFIEHFDSKVINTCNTINNTGLNEDISYPSIYVPTTYSSFDLPPSTVIKYNYIIISSVLSFSRHFVIIFPFVPLY